LSKILSFYGQRIGVLKSGNDLFEGTPAELKAHAERSVWEYRVSPNEFDIIMAEKEVIQLLEEGDGVNVRVFAKKEEEGAEQVAPRLIDGYLAVVRGVN